MAGKGPLTERAAAPLLLAAALFDVLLLAALARLIYGSIAPVMLPLVPAGMQGLGPGLLVVLLMPLLWLVSDVLAGGHSPGRLALGLEMTDTAGRSLPLPRRAKRFAGKFFCFGLAGLSPRRLAPYDRMARIVWRSPLAQPSITEWRLVFVNGPYAGKGRPLADLPGFDPASPIRIGRDPAWAQIALKDPQVSGRHCEIKLAADGAVIRDLGSNNGTTVNGRPIAAGKWVPLAPGQEFSVAGQRLVIRP